MKNRGFTLIELVMIIVLLGIMAVFAAPRLGNITATNAGAFTDKLRADIRYAQNLAMTRNRRTMVNFTASGYAVTQDNSAAGGCTSFVPASDPASGGDLTVALDTGNYAGITITPSQCLEYDSLGRPYVCGGGACSTTLSDNMSISVQANTVAVGTVTVTAQTGAVN